MRSHRRRSLPGAAAVAALAVVAFGCGAEPAPRSDAHRETPRKATLARAPFGQLDGGRAVEIFTLTSGSGMQVRTMPYGAAIVSVRVPDRDGALADVVLGFDTLADYVTKNKYFGVVVGRYGNRIARGRFTLDGRTYQLATNDGPNHLHGGVKGYDTALWQADPFERDGRSGVVYRHTSPDDDEGYPGALDVRVTYTIGAANELTIEYEATTDKPTPINLTQHSYFNLTGDGRSDVLGHWLTIDADRFTPVDATLIPTGALAPVDGTPFDFRQPTAIGARIGGDHEQLRFGSGYDHNWVINRQGPGLVHAARVADPTSGRTLDVSTTEPGVQFYSGNFLDGTVTGKSGRMYGKHYGLCLETQHFPDSPNQPDFPSTILRPGGRYQSKTVLAFGVTK